MTPFSVRETCRIDAPFGGCRLHQHRAGRRSRLPERPGPSDGRRRPARSLDDENRATVVGLVGRSVRGDDLVEPDIELLGEALGLRGVDTLAHLHRRQGEGHRVVGSDVDEGVEARAGRHRLVRARTPDRQLDADQQAAGERGAATQQSAARRAGAGNDHRIRTARHA